MGKLRNNVPRVRFKGFDDFWGIKKLKEITTKVNEKNRDKAVTETFTNSAQFGIISQKDFFDKDISNSDNLFSYYIVKPNDFVYNPRISNYAPVGPIKRNKLNRVGVMSPLYYVFRIYSADYDFIEHYFSTSKWHKFMLNNGDTGARSDRFSISNDTFNQMPILLPTKPEQTQIGNFFQKLDKLIELSQARLEQVKTYKKAMLQKMFPQQGETVPQIRFKRFSGDWSSCYLDKIAIRLDSQRRPVSEEKRILGNTPYYGANGIQSFINGHTHEGDFILVAEDGANDLNNYPILHVSGKIWVNNHAHVLSAIDKISDTKFLSFNLQTFNFKPYLVGGSRAKLNANIMMNIEISIPSIEEQTKIGNFFQKLDQNIEQHQRKLEHYQSLKKAMLQRMFV